MNSDGANTPPEFPDPNVKSVANSLPKMSSAIIATGTFPSNALPMNSNPVPSESGASNASSPSSNPPIAGFNASGNFQASNLSSNQYNVVTNAHATSGANNPKVM